MKRFLTAIMLGVFIALGLGMCSSYAGEMDVLLQKLVEKGILSASEAQQVRTETNEEIAKIDKQKQEDYKTLSKDSLPDWVKNTKLKGDFRVRYENDRFKATASKASFNQSRERIRARLGVISQVNNKLEMGVGIATTTGADPRSRNITLGSDSNNLNTPGSGKGICLDYAYGNYTPVKGVSLIGGKYINPLWQPHDIFWDPNITPEGAALTLNYDPNPKLQLFMNDMFYWLKNDGSTAVKSPMMFALQPGATFKINNDVTLKGAVAAYIFSDLKNTTVFSKGGGTNSNDGVAYKYSYDSIQPSVEISFKKPFNGPLPFASLFGDFIYNTSLPSSEGGAKGFDAGIKFGNEDTNAFGRWQGRLAYSAIGRDAWLDSFTNADRYYPGKTDSKDYEAILDYGLGKNTWLRLRYYYAQSLSKVGNTDHYAPENVYMADWNMKF